MRIKTKISIYKGSQDKEKLASEEEFSVLIGSGKWNIEEIESMITPYSFQEHLKRALLRIVNLSGNIIV